MNEQRLCLDCGGVLHGRVDKKFCDDQCRSNYNNRLNSESNAHVKHINSILKRNRKILEEFNSLGKVRVMKQKLLSKGFDFSYLTSFYKSGVENIYCFCYDQGYTLLENDEVLLVKKEDNDE